MRSEWVTIGLRSVDSVVSLYVDGQYSGSFRSQETDGMLGMLIIGENHVQLDNRTEASER